MSFQIFLQLFPQIEEMVQVLKSSLDHYEQLKLMEDMLKEDTQTKKVRTCIIAWWARGVHRQNLQLSHF